MEDGHMGDCKSLSKHLDVGSPLDHTVVCRAHMDESKVVCRYYVDKTLNMAAGMADILHPNDILLHTCESSFVETFRSEVCTWRRRALQDSPGSRWCKCDRT
jgi:hypothetical protein